MTSAILAVLLATQGNPVYQSTGSTPFEGGACDGQRVQISADDGTMFCCVSSVWERCGTAKGASVLLTQPHAAFPDGVAVSSIVADGFLVGHTGSGTISSYLGASCTLPQVVRVIGPTGAVTCSQPSNVTGNAATATALAANPADCAANEYAHTIAASGALTCSQVAYSQVSGTPTSLSGEPFVTTAASSLLTNESVLPTCSGTDKLTFNGTTISCATDETTGGGSGYTTIQDEGSSLTTYTTLNFAGAGVTCADDTSKTTCTIPSLSAEPFVTMSASSNLSAEVVVPTCTGNDKLTSNGSAISCATDQTGSAPARTTMGAAWSNATTSYTNVLTVGSLSASTKYLLDCDLTIRDSVATVGVRFRFNSTGSMTSMALMVATASAATTMHFQHHTALTTAGVQTANLTTANAARISGIFTTNTATNISIEGAAETTGTVYVDDATCSVEAL